MSATAEKTDPDLWERVKDRVTQDDKGGHAGEWSARKAQLAVKLYKAEGGGYARKKSADNHLAQWTREDWGTRSGKNSGDTGERYLPREVRETLSDADHARTTRKKRKDSRAGHQFSSQPADVAGKTAEIRHRALGGETRAALYRRAQAAGIPGRSRMSRDELARALQR